MIKKIAFIGATGMLGRPVIHQLTEAGFDVTALVRSPDRADLGDKLRLIKGDLKNPEDVDQLLEGKDAVYISLSILQNEKENDWHTETDGMKIILASAQKKSIQRILLLSSLVQRYQRMNNFSWWVFGLKDESVEMVKQSGISYTIFFPSTFMESFLGKYRQGKRILLGGKSEHRMYYIAGEDYGKQVAQTLLRNHEENKEYVIQGLEALTQEEAADIFVQHYKREKLSISKAPLGILKFLGLFSTTVNYGARIVEALNKYPEKFESEETWKALGKPVTTLQKFAESA